MSKDTPRTVRPSQPMTLATAATAAGLFSKKKKLQNILYEKIQADTKKILYFQFFQGTFLFKQLAKLILDKEKCKILDVTIYVSISIFL